ncbi:hypothetical protein VaNZ11_015782 [Volvox africanus]|uniref:Protein kinase domain-containing protein n=1 Tax=Volvox africanus TaxID=51714 RepID=A0ABQ5SL82_9CHLO|nr:hypothetical protein VaNZ11_015782 [Volvox africanus]
MPRPAVHSMSMPLEERYRREESSTQHYSEGACKSDPSSRASGIRGFSHCNRTLRSYINGKLSGPQLLRPTGRYFLCKAVSACFRRMFLYSTFLFLVLSIPALFAPVTDAATDASATEEPPVVAYCNTAASGSCPYCKGDQRSPCYLATTTDSWYTHRSWCILESPVGACGKPYTYDMIAQNNKSNIGGQVFMFQDVKNRLFITFKLYCPYTIRPGSMVIDDDVDEKYSLGVYVWNTTRQASRYQYSDGVSQYSGTFSCLTAVIDLNNVCDPSCSQFSNDPFAQLNKMCSPDLTATSCPPGNVSTHRDFVVQPYFNAFTTFGSQCRISVNTTTFILNGTENSNYVRWDAQACGPKGTPLAAPPPVPPSPPAPPAPLPPQLPTPPPPPPLPPSPPKPRSPSRPPPTSKTRSGTEPSTPPTPLPNLPPPRPMFPSSPPRLSSPPPISMPPSPKPPPPSPQPILMPPPPKPRPSSPPPIPMPPSPRPPPLPRPPPSSPAPTSSRPYMPPPLSPRVIISNPLPLTTTPPTGNPISPAKVPPSPLHPGETGEHLVPAAVVGSLSPSPPKEPSPPPPAPHQPAPPGHGNAVKDFFSSTGIGVLVGCSVVAAALICCCTVTIYIFCRRSTSDQMSVSGEQALSVHLSNDGGVNTRDDQSLSNFSFGMAAHGSEKDRSPSSSDAASFSAGIGYGDVERGSGSRTCGSNLASPGWGSMSGASDLQRAPTFQSELPSSSPSSQVYMKLEQGGNRPASSTSSDLLAMHAGQAAALRTQAQNIAAVGGAGSKSTAPVVSWPVLAPLRTSDRKASASPNAVGAKPQPQQVSPQFVAPITPDEPRPASGGGSFLKFAKRRFLPARKAPSTSEIPLAACQSVDFVPGATLGGGTQNASFGSATDEASPDDAVAAAAAINAVATLGAQVALGAGAYGGASKQLPSQPSAQQPPLISRLSSALRLGGSASVGAVAPYAGQEGLDSLSYRSRSASTSTAPGAPDPYGTGPITGAVAESPDGTSGSGYYPSVIAVPPAVNPAATLVTTKSVRRNDAGANLYPPLFSKQPSATKNNALLPNATGGTALASTQPVNRAPSQLPTIPSRSPLILPESTFATHAPKDLDDDDDGGRPSAGSLAPYGSALAGPTAPWAPPMSRPSELRPPDRTTSSGAHSEVTLSSPSLKAFNDSGSSGLSSPSPSALPAAALAAAQQPLHLPSASSLRYGTEGTRSSSPVGLQGRSSRENAFVDVSLPMLASSSFAAAPGTSGPSVSTSSGGSPWARTPLSSSVVPGQADSKFSFRSGGSGSNGGPDGGAAGSSFHSGSSRGPLTLSGCGGTPGLPPTSSPLPSSSPFQPPPLVAIVQPEVTAFVGSTSPSKLRSSGSIMQTPTPTLAPPAPLHLQPLDGPNGSLIRPPQPLAQQQRNSLPTLNLTSSLVNVDGDIASPTLDSRSSSPTPLQQACRHNSSNLSSPLSRSPSTSPLRHASSAASPLPSASCSPSLSRQPSRRAMVGMTSCPNSPPTGAGGSQRILSAGSLTRLDGRPSLTSTASAAWGSSFSHFVDEDSIRRYCGNGAGGDGGLLAAACGCNPSGEEVPLGGADAAGLTAVYNAVCKLEQGALFFNKYKIGGSPVMGRHSVVLLAKNVYSKARVAIKFHADYGQYQREKDALQALSSPYVPALHEPLDVPQLAALGLPPALVMEAGRCTLTEWLRGGPDGATRDLLSLKGALHQILAALMHMHSHRIVHRDIKPANIMWFDDAHRFKLIDLAESAAIGEVAPPCCTPLYSAPEQIKAALDGKACQAAVTPAADMWSFGIMAFEVFSGGLRFYGPSPTLEDVLLAVFGHQPLPSEGDGAMAGFDLVQARRLISNLVVRNPAQRWSAATCHKNALFASGDDTAQRATKWDSMLAHIATTTAEIRSAQMAINFVICKTTDPSPAGSPGLDRLMSSASASTTSSPPKLRHMDSSRVSRRCAYKEVPMIADDCLRGEPIFMLLLQKQYQIRITVAHAKGLQLSVSNIEQLKLTSPDNQVQVLPVRLETGLRDGTVEYVADWDPAASRSDHLRKVTPYEGAIQRRVVFLNAELVVQLSGVAQPTTVNTMLYVVMNDKQSARYALEKLKLWSTERWNQAPQWMRDVAKGTMVLVRLAGNVVGV